MMLCLWAQAAPTPSPDWVEQAIRLGERFGVAFLFAVIMAGVLWKVVEKQNTSLETIIAKHSETIKDLEKACAEEREETAKRLDSHHIAFIERETERSRESAARDQRTAEVYHQTLDKILQKVGGA